jgi:hypothetical protein
MQIKCQNYSVQELVVLLRAIPADEEAHFKNESLAKLAEWLEKLYIAETAVYNARVALAACKPY